MARNKIQFQKGLSEPQFNELYGTYRQVSPKHRPRYLAEFQYRFNRRNDLSVRLTRLGDVSLHTPPFAFRYVRLAESRA